MSISNEATVIICKVFSCLTSLSILLLFIIYFRREKWNITTSLNIQLCISCILHTIAYIFWEFGSDSLLCKFQAAYEPATFSGIFSFCTVIVYTAYIMFSKPEKYTSHQTFFKIWTSLSVWFIVIFIFCLNIFTDSYMQTSMGQCRGGKSIPVVVIYFIIIFASTFLTIFYLILLVKSIYPALKLSDSSSHKKYYFKRMIVIIIIESLILVLFGIFIFLESKYQLSGNNSKLETSTITRALVIIESIIPLIVVVGFCYNEKTIEDMKILFCFKKPPEEIEVKLMMDNVDVKQRDSNGLDMTD